MSVTVTCMIEVLRVVWWYCLMSRSNHFDYPSNDKHKCLCMHKHDCFVEEILLLIAC